MGRNVIWGEMLWGEMSWGEMLRGELSFGVKCYRAKKFLKKFFLSDFDETWRAYSQKCGNSENQKQILKNFFLEHSFFMERKCPV